MSLCHYIQDYIDLVNSGKYRVCKWQPLLIEFVQKVFENESVYVDEEQADKYFELQKYFTYKLFEWEKFCFVLHNCTYISPGVLRFPTLVIDVGRGAGKNGYLAFEDFALTTPVNGIREFDIDICATSEKQAKTSFVDIYNLLERHRKKMQKHFYWNRTEIKNLKTGSVIRYRTSNAKSADGGRPGKVDFDEYHAYENYDLINVFKTGFGKKPMPRETITTTMGDVRDGPLDNLVSDGKSILKGDIPDNGTLFFFCQLDADEEVNDEANWYKANPSLQYFPELLREMRKEYQEFLRDNFGNASFMTKRQNRPFGTTEVPVTKWENILATNRPVIDLEGATCVFGIDYTKTTDFLAVGLMFIKDGFVYWKTHSWLCEQCRDLSRIRFPINDAIQRGLLTKVSGVEIPPELPAEWLAEQKQHYNIIRGALDNYRFTLLKKPLEQIGFDPDKKNGNNNLYLVRPSDIMQVYPIITSDFDNQRIIWGDDPLMRWYTNNTKVVRTKNNNYTYDKIEPKSRKNDGFMALVAAYTQKEYLQSNAISAAQFDYMNVYTF